MWEKLNRTKNTELLNIMASYLDKQVNNFIIWSQQNVGVNLTLTNVIQIMIKYYGYQNMINIQQLQYTLMQSNDNIIYKKNFMVLYDILNGKNTLGNILHHDKLVMRDDIGDYVINKYSQDMKENIDEAQAISMKDVINFMLKPNYNIQCLSLYHTNYQSSKQTLNILCQQLCNYRQYLVIKQQKLIQHRQQLQDQEKQKQQQLITLNQIQLYMELLKQIYEKYRINSDPYQQQILFQLFLHLQEKSPSQVCNLYQINDIQSLSQLLDNISIFGQITSLRQLNINAILNQITDNTSQTIIFNKDFNPSTIQSSDWQKLFLNIDSRLQFINMQTQANMWTNTAIIHCVQSNDIYHITDLAVNPLNNLDDCLIYDMIINGETEINKNFFNLKIRYLSYLGNKTLCQLHDTSYLISISLMSVNLVNISKCINLKNLYSSLNSFKCNDIHPLANLVRLFSCDDTYSDSNQSMLETVIQMPNIEYLSIIGGTNTLRRIEISLPLTQLRCLLLRFNSKSNDLDSQKNQIIIDTKMAQLDKLQFVQVENGDLIYKYNIEPLNMQKVQNTSYLMYLSQKYENNQLPEFYKQMGRLVSGYNQQQDVTEQIIFKLFGYYRKESPQTQFAIYMFIQELPKLSNEYLLRQFQINKHQILSCADSIFDYAENISQLRVQILFSRYSYSYNVKISFNQSFTFESIEDKDWINISDNYMHSLQNIIMKDGGILKSFIVLRRVTDNKIYKQNFISDTFMLQFPPSDTELYDVVIFSDQASVTSISKLKIRCLHYYQMHQHVNMKLQYPKYVTQLSICNIKITNLNSCTNICQMFSSLCQYKIQDFRDIKLLKKLILIHIECENQNEELANMIIKQNMLQYVGIYDCKNVFSQKKSIPPVNFQEIKFLNILQDQKQIIWSIIDGSNKRCDLGMIKYDGIEPCDTQDGIIN